MNSATPRPWRIIHLTPTQDRIVSGTGLKARIVADFLRPADAALIVKAVNAAEERKP